MKISKTANTWNTFCVSTAIRLIEMFFEIKFQGVELTFPWSLQQLELSDVTGNLQKGPPDLYPMYAHLYHPEDDLRGDDKSSSRRILHYYQQSHQYQQVNPRSLSPMHLKTPLAITTTRFPPSQLYHETHMSSLHDGELTRHEKGMKLTLNFAEYISNEYRLNREAWPQETTTLSSMDEGSSIGEFRLICRSIDFMTRSDHCLQTKDQNQKLIKR